MRKIRAITYGIGQMGKIISTYMVEKGIEIVGAIDTNPGIVGKDLGEVIGFSYPLGVKINDNADEVLSKCKADIAVLAIFTQMERMYPYFKKCIENKLNVITTSEEALYPWTISPQLTLDLDKLAKANNVTITGSGFQDTFWINMLILLTGVCHVMESVIGQQKYNIDEGGPEGLKKRHVGETEDEFYQKIKEHGLPPSYPRMALEAVIATLGLTIRDIKYTAKPTVDEVDIYSRSLGGIVKKGSVTGMTQIIEIDTKNNIRFREELTAKVYKEGEVDVNKWNIKGVPDICLENNKIATADQTCTQIVNRIPDILNSEPGFITVEKLPMLKFRVFPLESYLINNRFL